MANSNVIITGAHGFIGRHVSRIFEREGWRVVGVDHTPWQQGKPSDWGIAQWLVGEITTDVLASLMIRPAAIVHCAGSGSVGFSYVEPVKDFKYNVETTINALEFIRLYAPNAVLIIPSSAAVYGLARKLPTPPDHPTNPVSPYGVHKLMTEMLCRSYQRHFDVTAVIIRFFSMFGEGQSKLLLWDACRKISSGKTEFFGSGDETRDFLHVEDAAALIKLAAIKAPRGEISVINGGTGKSVTVRAIIEELVQLLNCETIPVFNGQTRTGDPSHYLADISEPLRWGWRPAIKLPDGLKRYVEWWQRVDAARISMQ
jgi:UDP-glucose 4-epimerase